jgi:predicted RNase H-like HicB family nuclease
MDTINYVVKVHPAVEGGYWAEVPALPGCFSQGGSLSEVRAMIEAAIECHLRALIERGEPFPVEKRPRRVFAFPVSVRALKLT